MNIRIDEWFEKFNQLYSDKNDKTVEKGIHDLIEFNDHTVILGTKMDDWCTTFDEVKRLVIRQYETYDFDFNFDSADVFETEESIFISSIGSVQKQIDKEVLINSTIIKSLNELKSEVTDESKAFRASRTISEALIDMCQGDVYTYPLRFAAFLKKGQKGLKAYHIQFSFDAEFLWQHRFLSLSALKELSQLENKSDSTDIRTVLNSFQDFYLKRDEACIEEMMTLFSGLDNMIGIGTDLGEHLKGQEAIKEMILSDWEYWGDFKLNVNGAVVIQCKQTAYFTTEASIFQRHDVSTMEDSAVKLMQFKLENKAISNKMKLLEALKASLALHYEKSLGTDYYAPMRFSGYLIHVNGQWKFQYIQFSDYIKQPEKRQSVCS